MTRADVLRVRSAGAVFNAGRLPVGAAILSAALIVLLSSEAHRVRLAGLAVVGGLVLLAYGALVLSKPAVGFVIAWVVAVLQQPIGALTRVSVAGHINDALLIVLLVGVGVRRLLGSTTVATRPRLLLVPLLIGLLGLAPALLTNDFGSWTVIGGWLSLRFWLFVLVALAVPWQPRDVTLITRTVIVTALVVTAFAVVDYVAPATLRGFLHTTPGPLETFRAHEVQSVFPSSSRYSNFMTVAAAVTLGRYVTEHRRRDIILALVFAVAGLASLRLRGLLALLSVAVVLILVQRGRRLARLLQFGILAAVCLVVLGASASAFSTQFDKFTQSTNQTARGQLYANAVTLAERRPPFGVGFGRFGSYASSMYYSPYYVQLGMSQEWGFSPQQPFFLTDTTWSGYIAETGFLGTSVFALGLMVLALRLWFVTLSGSVRSRTPAVTGLGLLTGAVVMSVGSAALLDTAVIAAVAMYFGCASYLFEQERARRLPRADPS